MLKFLDAVIAILKQNSRDARDKNSSEARFILNLIQHQSAPIKLNKTIKAIYYLQWILTLIFLTVYLGLSAADFRSVVTYPDNPEEEIISSISADTAFACLVSKMAANNLVSALYNRFLIFCQHAWLCYWLI